MSVAYPEPEHNLSTESPSLRTLSRHALTSRRLGEIASPAGATGLVKARGGLPAVLAELRRRAPIDGGEGER